MLVEGTHVHSGYLTNFYSRTTYVYLLMFVLFFDPILGTNRLCVPMYRKAVNQSMDSTVNKMIVLAI